ncbi:MAG: glycosyltransferase family 39 protein [Planctomycetes bacterium]|nr:glycosyltransferase family 39 protein [Planctomycetota bacterium]MBU1517394.1 glycosyltransferase family 39 protein [Planctomycetota bacterium]MBU2597308.1 glycosyltransferase family 39 protein [Planctomycetota bacterium]
MKNNRLIKRWDLIYITILVAITLVIGIYLIATTVLIARDGTFYIELAKKIADNPVEAIRNMSSCPGYPFLIYLMHKTAGLFGDSESLQSWIISAQAVSLLSKVIASIALYFVGSYFVGSRISFWGVLILSILPDSAKFGSDALTEWPHLMFLATGFLLLLLGTQYRKNWMFGWAGIIAGLGYLVRSESCQLVLYGGVWLIFNLIRPQGKMRRTKAAGALILLLAGFLVIAIPYMRSKGYVFPDQGLLKLPAILSVNDNCISKNVIARSEATKQSSLLLQKQDCFAALAMTKCTPVAIAPGSDFFCGTNVCIAGIYTSKTMGNKTLTKNICETLMYYFVPALLIGCYYYFRRQSKTLEQAFYAAAFIILNVAMLSWQILHQHFLSRRHTLALVAFTAFYIPIGIEIIAGWINRSNSKRNLSEQKGRQNWFLILLIIGIVICLPKLLTPIRSDKQSYRQAAKWLMDNTAPTDIIAVPDMRIVFYAERKGLKYDENIPEQADYIVRIVKGDDEKLGFGKNTKQEYSTWMNSKKSRKLVICRVIH